MLFALLVVLAAQGADPAAMAPPQSAMAPDMPPDMPPAEGAGAPPQGGPGWGGHSAGPRPRIFIAPSGELFKAAADAGTYDENGPVATWFARADADHDGKLTQAEFTADFAAYAASLDSNHDGIIDSAEVKAYEAAIAAAMPARGGGGHGWGQGGGEAGRWRGSEEAGGQTGGLGGANPPANRPHDWLQGEARFGILPLAEPVAAMDTLGDGRITQAEVQAAAASRFAQLDTRRRGYLTLADLPKTPAQQMRARMREHMRQGGGWGGGNGGAARGGDAGPPPMDMPPGDMGQ